MICIEREREREGVRKPATLHSLCIYPCGSLHTCRSNHKSRICNQIHKNTNKAKCQQSCQIYMAHTQHTCHTYIVYSCTFRAATNLLTNQSASMQYPIKRVVRRARGVAVVEGDRGGGNVHWTARGI